MFKNGCTVVLAIAVAANIWSLVKCAYEVETTCKESKECSKNYICLQGRCRAKACVDNLGSRKPPGTCLECAYGQDSTGRCYLPKSGYCAGLKSRPGDCSNCCEGSYCRPGFGCHMCGLDRKTTKSGIRKLCNTTQSISECITCNGACLKAVNSRGMTYPWCVGCSNIYGRKKNEIFLSTQKDNLNSTEGCEKCGWTFNNPKKKGRCVPVGEA